MSGKAVKRAEGASQVQLSGPLADRVTQTGFKTDPSWSLEQHVEAGRWALRLGDALQWALGDLALSVQTKYGECDLQKWCVALGIKYDTGRQYRYVASRYGIGDRSPNLSWKHHLIAAPHEDRLDLLRLAEQDGWSTQELKKHLKKRERPSPFAEAAPLPGGEYGTIVANPPWRYPDGWLWDTRQAHGPGVHTQDIIALPIAELAKPDSVLWLCTTNLHVPDAFRLIRASGFEWRTMFTYPGDGGGYYVQAATEHAIVAVRGKPNIKRMAGVSTLLETRERLYELAESMCPGPYLALFARGARRGWDMWQWRGEAQAA